MSKPAFKYFSEYRRPYKVVMNETVSTRTCGHIGKVLRGGAKKFSQCKFNIGLMLFH